MTEICENWNRTPFVLDQVGQLASLAGLPYRTFAPGLGGPMPLAPLPWNGVPGMMGNAILSRYPIQSSSVLKYGGPGVTENGMSAVAARISIAGTQLVAVSTRMLPGPEQSRRVDEAHALMSFLSPMAGPKIVGGDLNGGADDHALHQVFLDHGFTHTEQNPSWERRPADGSCGRSQADHIYVNADLRSHDSGCQGAGVQLMVTPGGPTDHPIVRATVALTKDE